MKERGQGRRERGRTNENAKSERVSCFSVDRDDLVLDNSTGGSWSPDESERLRWKGRSRARARGRRCWALRERFFGTVTGRRRVVEEIMRRCDSQLHLTRS